MNGVSALIQIIFGLLYAIFILLWAVYILIIIDTSCLKTRKER